MALVISFVPDPAKAIAEMARVVRPGGYVATYMWDIPGGGLPLEPIHQAMHHGHRIAHSAGFANSRQDENASALGAGGTQSVETRVIRITVTYSGFDDFWDSNSVPVGPAGQAINKLAPAAREQFKAHLRKQLPEGPDGASTMSHSPTR